MRAIASLTLSFGLVSIPVKLYSATESSAAIRFKLMSRGGARLRQRYVADETPSEAEEVEAPIPAPPRLRAASQPAPAAIGRSPHVQPAVREEPADEEADEPAPRPAYVEHRDIVKGYEFEQGRFVLFTPAELKALQDGARDSIDIVAFIPQGAVDPLYYDKAYLLAPDKRGEKTYSLLLAALQASGRCALAKWAWRSKQYVVEVRPAEGGLVLQQLLYADEVRSLDELDIALAPVGEAELKLALQLIEQATQDRYDPSAFVDEEKQRILAAVEQKIAGREIVATEPAARTSGQVIDLLETLRASLRA
ncbi:MAG TPA: Ku protein, partial [Albitalea sp.]|nr:Ku protein [Albitalea sp.]